MSNIHPNLVLAALAEAEGDAFERFFKEFGAGVFGLNFMPLGGRHDGGADGFAHEGLFETNRRLTYFQASVQENHRSKIKSTVERLREYGREIGTLSYFTSRLIGDTDQEALELSSLHDTNIVIYDGQWIANRINSSDLTKAAFENHLRFYANLTPEQRKNSSISTPSSYNLNAAVFVAQHMMISSPQDSIRGVVLDSLALFALEEATLEGTPYSTSMEILARMHKAFPEGFDFKDDEVAERLALLSTKTHPHGRQIVWDNREGAYSLPWEARQSIGNDHAALEALIFRVREEVRSQIQHAHELDDLPSETLGKIVDAVMRCLEQLFMNDGLRLTQFLDGAEEDLSEDTVQDSAVTAMRDLGLSGKGAPAHLAAMMAALRSVFYQTTESQKEHMAFLSRTYALMFSMKYDLKISSYFADMKSKFRLLVGTDVIIQALSEVRLLEEDRATHGMLKALSASGAELILTDFAVEEVYTHIVAANEEYLNHYAEQDKYMTLDLARQSDRILLRAYYYSRFVPPSPSLATRTWGEFLNNILPYAELRTGEARIALRTFLREKFGMRLETRTDLEQVIDAKKHNQLAQALIGRGIKNRWDKAWNDAAHVLLVYALRAEANEIARASPVGYRTWWLTSETAIQRGFEELIQEHGKAIMRPQVAGQLLSFAPNSDEVRRAFGAVMPSLVGVRLGNRSHPSVLRSILDRVAEVGRTDPARMKAEMERLANRLKSDERVKVERLLG